MISSSPGANHFLALKYDGTVWAWGSNNKGQLGRTGITLSRVPIEVVALRDKKVISVAAGFQHSVALTADGDVYTWGDNSHGQLGIPLPSGQPYRPVDTGGIYAYPANTSFVAGTAVPTKIVFWKAEPNDPGIWGAAELPDDSKIVAIAAGDRHTLALTRHGWASLQYKIWDGGVDSSKFGPQGMPPGYNWQEKVYEQRIYAWGDNAASQLGVTGYSVNQLYAPVPAAAFNDSHVSSLSAGAAHSVANYFHPIKHPNGDGSYSPRVENVIYGFGDNSKGQLGVGSGASTPYGISIASTTDATTSLVPLAGANATFCIFPFQTGYPVFALGDNTYGQLGLGNHEYRTKEVVLNPTSGAIGFTPESVVFNRRLLPDGNATLPASGHLVALIWDAGSSLNHHGIMAAEASTNAQTSATAVAASPRSITATSSSSGTLVSVRASANATPVTQYFPDLKAPCWLRIERTPSTREFVVYGSADTSYSTPKTWTELKRHTFTAFGTYSAWGTVTRNENGAQYPGYHSGDSYMVGFNPPPVTNATGWLYPHLAPAVLGWDSVKGLAAGQEHTLAVLGPEFNRAVAVWGRNNYGQLGLNDALSRTLPTIIPYFQFYSVAAARNTSIGVTPEGLIYSWGQNNFGQLGNNVTIASRDQPGGISVIPRLWTDIDQDGLPDEWENLYAGRLNGPDSDADGVSDVQEFLDQTSPIEPDTDGDGLDDGYERSQPLMNGSVWTPADADFDHDGVSNAIEAQWGSNSMNDDSDGDGESDYQEHESKTDPNDPGSNSSSGEHNPPPALQYSATVSLNNNTGESMGVLVYEIHDGSERLVKSLSESSGGGTLEEQISTLRTDRVYRITATLKGSLSDYDSWSLTVSTAEPNIGIGDPDYMNGYDQFYVYPDGKGIYLLPYDLDIDSDNNNATDQPDGTKEEEQAEEAAPDDTHPGKVVLTNIYDGDGDAIAGYADGFDRHANIPDDDLSTGKPGLPVTLSIFKIPNRETKVRFQYSFSDPDAISSNADVLMALPEQGKGRLWKKSLTEPRKMIGVEEEGDLIKPNVWLTADDLGADAQGFAQIYFEAVRPSDQIADIQITAEFDLNADEFADASDTVRVTASEIRLMGRGKNDEQFREFYTLFNSKLDQPANFDTTTEVVAPQAADIGMHLAGITRFMGDAFDLTFGGSRLLTTPADSCYFVYAPAQGDQAISATLLPLTENGFQPEAGLAIRTGIEEGSPSFYVGRNAAGRLLVKYRQTPGAAPVMHVDTASDPATAVSVMITREGTTLRAFGFNSQSAQWQQLGGDVQIASLSAGLAGLVGTSGTHDSQSLAAIYDVSLPLLEVSVPGHANATPGQYVVYRYELKDPRTELPGPLKLGDAELALVKEGNSFRTEEFICYAAGTQVIYSPVPERQIEVTSGQIRVEYNPWYGADMSTKLEPDTAWARWMDKNLAEIQDDMRANWTPNNPNDPGAYGKELHRRFADRVAKSRSKLIKANAIFEPLPDGTHRFHGFGKGTGAPAGMIEVDVIKVGPAAKLVPGNIVPPEHIEAVVDIKASASKAVFSAEQRAAYLALVAGDERKVMVNVTKWRWSSATQQIIPNKAFFAVAASFTLVGAANAVGAYMTPEAYDGQLAEVIEAQRMLQNQRNQGAEKAILDGFAIEFRGKVIQYMQNFFADPNEVNLPVIVDCYRVIGFEDWSDDE